MTQSPRRDDTVIRPDDEVRVDLHVHSCHSDRPYSWFLRSGKSAECYTRPETVVDLAHRRGMNLVTISDHDEIAGALELCARHDDAFVSEEVSARFPEDGCILHTIVIGITEAQHAELQRLRRNIYELVAYMQHERIAHFLCHPLSDVNRRLKAEHVRKALLMFPALEMRNGTRNVAHEEELERILATLTPKHLASWASDHPEVPFVVRDARYALVGGSDDHGGIAIARAYTSYRGERSVEGLKAALLEKRTVPSGIHGTPETLSHNVYGVLHGYLKEHGDASHGGNGLVAPLRQHLFTGAVKEKVTVEVLQDQGHTDELQDKLIRIVEGSLVAGGRDALGAMATALAGSKLGDFTDAVPNLLRTAMLSVPYVLGTRYQQADRATAQRLTSELGFGQHKEQPPRVAIVSDTIDGVDGVSLGLRRLVAASRRAELPLWLVGAGDDPEIVDDGEVVRIPTILRHAFEFYPSVRWGVPHLPALMRWLVEHKIEVVQCATPGPMGLAAMAAARMLKIPVFAQYHTEVAEYATRMTGDPMVGTVLGAVVAWFYRQVDACLVPSQAVAERLAGFGVDAARIHRVQRGIDLALFQPERRDRSVLARWGLEDRPVILYVGRVSKEKNLDALFDAYVRVRAARPDAALLVVGDGPYAEALRPRADALGAVLAGTVMGPELAALFASADVFAFPSETETFGNVVVEAQASGLPVVVAAAGAAHETVTPGVTGFVVDGQDPERFASSILTILEDPALRARMSRAAHRAAQRYDVTAAARATFALYRRILEDAPEITAAPGGAADADRSIARRVAAPEAG